VLCSYQFVPFLASFLVWEYLVKVKAEVVDVDVFLYRRQDHRHRYVMRTVIVPRLPDFFPCRIAVLTGDGQMPASRFFASEDSRLSP
jgi:hypothetical protein